jgi:hypothetical protein
MARTDKPVPLDPKRHSTNKRVKAGAAPATSARVMKPVPTVKQAKVAGMMQRANKNAAVRDGIKAAAVQEIRKRKGVISPLVGEALRKANRMTKGGNI